ncbi:hypothetical protein EON63_10735 [archaeon]|nr:MAG: hypothetical protein EON63_10735 [archaeon]
MYVFFRLYGNNLLIIINTHKSCRSAGFIAVHATLASGDVDLCLVPEINIQLEGEEGCLPHIMQRWA